MEPRPIPNTSADAESHRNARLAVLLRSTRMRWPAALALLFGVAGCGVYSVTLDPPPRVASRAGTPLDLSVSLGDVRSLANGRTERVDAATVARDRRRFRPRHERRGPLPDRAAARGPE